MNHEPAIHCLDAQENTSRVFGWADLQQLVKPRLNGMVLLTALLGYLLAPADQLNILKLLCLLLGLGAAAVGASILNQYLERDTDAAMNRTRSRPLPQGIVSPLQALCAGNCLVLIGIVVLAVGVHALAGILTAVTSFSYLLFYTPLKRITPLSTIIGAIPGALPPMIGWTAATGQIQLGSWVLFSILFAWQLPHFFAIGWIYRQEYLRAGIPIIPVLDSTGQSTAQHILMCTLNLIFVSLVPAALGFAGVFYLIFAVACGLGIFWVSLNFWRQPSIQRARAVLFGSLIYLPVILTLWLLNS